MKGSSGFCMGVPRVFAESARSVGVCVVSDLVGRGSVRLHFPPLISGSIF